MCGEQNDYLFSDLTEQVVEAVAFLWVQTCSRFIYNDQLWVAQQCLCNTKSLPHPSGKSADSLFSDSVEIGLL
jgi:hypothetical protein